MISSTCRICDSSELEHKYTVNNLRLDKCNVCNFVQVAKQPTSEELEEIYKSEYFAPSKYAASYTIMKEYQRRMKLMESSGIKNGAKVLDAGCAVGDFISFVGDKYQMWGTDISEYAIEKARENNPSIEAARFSSGLVEDQVYEPESFDAIVLWDVIEHLWDPAATVKDLLNYIRPGGILIVSTPNIGSFSAKVFGKLWAFLTPPEHLGFFEKKTFEYLFEKKNSTKIIKWTSKGKWVNFAFMLYKIKRKISFFPGFLIKVFQKGILGKLAIYVPTADIQYVAIKK